MNILMMLANPFTHDPRVYNEAKSLVDAGHEVTVLAWDKTGHHPAQEMKDGIQVVRSYNTRFMDLMPFDIFRLHLWWRKGYRDAMALFDESSFDAVHCHDFSSLPIGVKLKKKFDIKLVYDAHEIWGYMVKKDLPWPWWRYYLWEEGRIITHVDNIITVNEPLEEYFNRVSDKPITIVMNAKPLQADKYEAPDNKNLTLLYIGNLSPPRFLLELVDVVADVDGVYCIIGGKGSKQYYVNALKNKCSKVENIEFIGKVPMKQVVPMTKKADVVICMFNPLDKNSKVGLPNKVFEAMVSGRPIIVTKDVYLGRFVEKENIGMAIPFGKKYLKNAIVTLRDNPELCERVGRNALNAAIKEYNWAAQKKKLLTIYEGLG